MNKIAIIILYFGKVPVYIDLFLKGCAQNKQIDFIFITDWDYATCQFSPNCVLIPYSTDQFKLLAKEKFGFQIALNHAFKLCDLKPSWIFLFENFVSKYKYVGWCDIDLIFGNLSSFFYEELFSKYDFVTVTDHFISGAFTLLKNDPKYTTIFKNAKGWEEIFQNERHYAFDEGLRIEQNSGKDSFSSMMKREEDEGRINVLHKICAFEGHPQNMIYNNGSITENNVEYAMFHFVIAKRNSFFVFPDWPKIPDQFGISKFGFSQKINKKVSVVSLLFNSFYRRQVNNNLKKKLLIVGKLVKEMDFRRLYIGFKRQFFTKKWILEK